MPPPASRPWRRQHNSRGYEPARWKCDQAPGSGLHSFCDLIVPACHLTWCAEPGLSCSGACGPAHDGSAFAGCRFPLNIRMNPVAYFEIPVADMPRAQRFYERVFGSKLDLAEIDGNQMALFPYAQGQPGASGALACGPSYVPGRSGARIYFSVEDIDAALALALQEGAEANYPVTEVPGYGWVAEFIDTEGNCVALYAATRMSSSALHVPQDRS